MRKTITLIFLFVLFAGCKKVDAAMVHSAEASNGRSPYLDEDIINVTVTEPSGLSVYKFNHLLEGTCLSGYGRAFFEMEKNTNTNGVFAIAVAMLEYGIESRARDGANNFFGMSYGGARIHYKSIEENIMAFGKLVQKPVYRNKTFARFAKIYCPPKAEFWTGVVRDKYRKLAAKANAYRCPDLFRLIYAFKLESSECF